MFYKITLTNDAIFPPVKQINRLVKTHEINKILSTLQVYVFGLWEETGADDQQYDCQNQSNKQRNRDNIFQMIHVMLFWIYKKLAEECCTAPVTSVSKKLICNSPIL